MWNPSKKSVGLNLHMYWLTSSKWSPGSEFALFFVSRTYLSVPTFTQKARELGIVWKVLHNVIIFHQVFEYLVL